MSVKNCILVKKEEKGNDQILSASSIAKYTCVGPAQLITCVKTSSVPCEVFSSSRNNKVKKRPTQTFIIKEVGKDLRPFKSPNISYKIKPVSKEALQNEMYPVIYMGSPLLMNSDDLALNDSGEKVSCDESLDITQDDLYDISALANAYLPPSNTPLQPVISQNGLTMSARIVPSPAIAHSIFPPSKNDTVQPKSEHFKLHIVNSQTSRVSKGNTVVQSAKAQLLDAVKVSSSMSMVTSNQQTVESQISCPNAVQINSLPLIKDNVPDVDTSNAHHLGNIIHPPSPKTSLSISSKQPYSEKEQSFVSVNQSAISAQSPAEEKLTALVTVSESQSKDTGLNFKGSDSNHTMNKTVLDHFSANTEPATLNLKRNHQSDEGRGEVEAKKHKRVGVEITFDDGIKHFVSNLKDMMYLDDEPIKSWGNLKRGCKVAARWTDGLYYDATIVECYLPPSSKIMQPVVKLKKIPDSPESNCIQNLKDKKVIQTKIVCHSCKSVFEKVALFRKHQRNKCRSHGISVITEDTQITNTKTKRSKLKKAVVSKTGSIRDEKKPVVDNSNKHSFSPPVGSQGQLLFQKGTKFLHRWQLPDGKSKWYNGTIKRVISLKHDYNCEFEVVYKDDEDHGPHLLRLYEDYPTDIRFIGNE